MNTATGVETSAFRKYEHSGPYHYALMDSDPFYVAKIRKALSLMPPGGVVLDVGCGDGVFVKYARQAGGHVVGIDPSEHGVRLARRMAGASELCVGSADRLPFQTASVDLVVMIDVVNYLSRCEAAIGEAARVLRPGGMLLMMSPHAVSLEAERAAIPDSWQTRAWTADELRAVTERHLRVVELAFIEKVVPLAGLVALSGWLRRHGWSGALGRLVSSVAGLVRRRRASTAPPSGPGNIVLNTLALPDILVRGREKLEFVVVARREFA